MCEYCGCRDIALIGQLSEEHYQAVDAAGVLRRAIDSNDVAQIAQASEAMGQHLIPHNKCEEAGLFHELIKDEYFCPTIENLQNQHVLMHDQLRRISEGEHELFIEFEHTLRRHIDQEENGLFPACAVAVDGPTWEKIDELTHAYNHATGRDHQH